MIIVQHGNVGLARDFSESVAYSVGILGDKVANLFYYHSRKNYGVDPSQLPQGIDKFDQALRSLLGGGAAIVVRECAKRLAPVLGLRIGHFPDNHASLYRKVSGSRGIMKENVPSRFAKVVGVLQQVFWNAQDSYPSGTPGAVREIFSSSGFFPLQEILLDRFASLRDCCGSSWAQHPWKQGPVHELLSQLRIGRRPDIGSRVGVVRRFTILGAYWTGIAFLWPEAPIHIVASKSVCASNYAISTANERRGNRRAAR